MEFVPLLALVPLLIISWYFYRTWYRGANTNSTSALNKYSKDLTLLANQNRLDPVIGRSEEIGRVIQILSRKSKNNPVLVGGAGVGKTAIAEGLALAIYKKKVTPALFNKRVLALDLPNILAGTKYRGEFEQRLKKITDEIVRSQRTIILFIDEIHILAEAGQAEGAINAADILKPLLARGELQVVGATTREEYEKYITNDKTLARRLQPVYVREANPAQTKEILKGVKPVYEKYHDVVIKDEALDEAVKATNKIKDRYYPDKAIDAIDEACSKVRIDFVSKEANKNNKNKLYITAKDVQGVVAAWNQFKN